MQPRGVAAAAAAAAGAMVVQMHKQRQTRQTASKEASSLAALLLILCIALDTGIVAYLDVHVCILIILRRPRGHITWKAPTLHRGCHLQVAVCTRTYSYSYGT